MSFESVLSLDTRHERGWKFNRYQCLTVLTAEQLKQWVSVKRREKAEASQDLFLRSLQDNIEILHWLNPNINNLHEEVQYICTTGYHIQELRYVRSLHNHKISCDVHNCPTYPLHTGFTDKTCKNENDMVTESTHFFNKLFNESAYNHKHSSH